MEDRQQPIDDFMTRYPIFANLSHSVSDARILCRRHGIHYLLVADAEGDLVGITCWCHLRSASPKDPLGQVAQRPVVFVSAGEPASQALLIMERCRVGCLPVIAETGAVEGIVTRHDFRKLGLVQSELGFERCVVCATSHDLHRGPQDEDMIYCNNCLARLAEQRDSLLGLAPSEFETWH